MTIKGGHVMLPADDSEAKLRKAIEDPDTWKTNNDARRSENMEVPATCKTCGGSVPSGHKPSVFDPEGIGHAAHAVKTGSPQPQPDEVEKRLDEILDELSFNGINDVSYCPGGHHLEKYGRDEAKAALRTLLIEAEYKGKRKMLRRMVVKGYLSDLKAIAHLTLIDAERTKALKDKNGER